MNLTPEDLSLFDDLLADGPTSTPPPAPAVVSPSARVLPPATPVADPGLPAPVAAKPSLIMPACAACGVDLNPDNASLLRSGEWKHVGCPAAPAPAAAAVAPPAAPKRTPKAKAAPVQVPGPAVSVPAHIEADLAAFGPPPARVEMAPPQAVVFELGPKTQALLGAFLAKFGGSP